MTQLVEARNNKGFAFVGYEKKAPVFRDLRVKIACDDQLKLYAPCDCGSGKKFKWCCNGRNL